MKQIFQKIYDENLWRGSESRSGPGSSRQATKSICDKLPLLIDSLSISSILDIPCGDFNWILQVLEKASINYIGGDIVEALVKQNTIVHSNYKFEVLDITSSSLPSADLLLMRDLLVHFSYNDILKAFANITRSHYKYVLMTHFTGPWQFRNCPTGQWYPVNFQSPPFKFSEPHTFVFENNEAYPDKTLSLWLWKDLCQSLENLK